MTDDEKRELIVEARELAPTAAFADGSAFHTIQRLADALEGTLTEPDEWEYGAVLPELWERNPSLGVSILAPSAENIRWQRNRGRIIVRRRKAGDWKEVTDD